MSIFVIILCTSLGNLFLKVVAPGALANASFILKFRLHLLKSTLTCNISTNNYFSYKTNST